MVRFVNEVDVNWVAITARQSSKLEPLIHSRAIIICEAKAGRLIRNDVAFMHFRIRKDGVGVVYNIATDLSETRKGRATELVDYLKRRCSKVIALCSVKNAAGCFFWLRQGFIPVRSLIKWNRRKSRFSEYGEFEWNLR